MPLALPQSNWQPTEILRWVCSKPSSTGVAIVVTDAGEGYLKAMGNPEGEHVLACELVATQLARLFALPTFDYALIEVTGVPEIWLPNGDVATPGPAFITRSEKGGSWGGKPRELKRLVNVPDISRLVVFDTWIRNRDRYTPPPNERCNRDNVFLSREAPSGKLLLRAMDHTHCFVGGGELTPRLSHIDHIRDSVVYGLFPEFRRFLGKDGVQAAGDTLHRIPRKEVEDVIQSIPSEWKVNDRTRAALADFLIGRAAYVAEHIMNWIWPQDEFEFMKEAEDEP